MSGAGERNARVSHRRCRARRAGWITAFAVFSLKRVVGGFNAFDAEKIPLLNRNNHRRTSTTVSQLQSEASAFAQQRSLRSQLRQALLLLRFYSSSSETISSRRRSLDVAPFHRERRGTAAGERSASARQAFILCPQVSRGPTSLRGTEAHSSSTSSTGHGIRGSGKVASQHGWGASFDLRQTTGVTRPVSQSGARRGSRRPRTWRMQAMSAGASAAPEERAIGESSFKRHIAVEPTSPAAAAADGIATATHINADAKNEGHRQPREQSGPAGNARPEVPGWKCKAVIIPGFATDARRFEHLCHRLERRGIASVVVPIRWYHWLPTLGGRSVRPILDRIHETVIRCVGAKTHKEMPYAFNTPGLQNEVAPYSIQDFLSEMDDPERGAHHMGPLDLPVVPAEPEEEERVILIAHSAGGWMSRIYLSDARYDGRQYSGSSLVNGLVTLGTPHVRLDDDEGQPRDLPFSRNFKFVEDFCSGEEGGKWEENTPTVCIGGAALHGRSSFGGLLKDLVYQSYELCCGDGSGMGDGITPLQSAFDMAGAKQYVQLEGVYHASGLGGPWYGSDAVIDSWLSPSLQTISEYSSATFNGIKTSNQENKTMADEAPFPPQTLT